MSGLSYFYNYLFYRIQNFYQKIGISKGSRFYAWLILSFLECLNILSVFFLLILTSTINVQKLGSFKLYSICLVCLLMNAVYFFSKRKDKKVAGQMASLPNVRSKRWQVLSSLYIILSLLAFTLLMILVRIHLQEIQAKAQSPLPFPMRQK